MHHIKFLILIIIFMSFEVLAYAQSGTQTRIDRRAVVSRNNPHISEPDTLGAFTVGNGHFAFTVDATGLQTFPEEYANGTPLTTMSDWGWHSFPNTQGFTAEDAWVEKDFGRGHKEIYSGEFRTEGRQRDAANYLRQNPHRLNLGCLGFDMQSLDKLTDVSQTLDLWNAVITSSFKYDGQPYHVTTVCSPTTDKVAVRVRTKGRVELVFRVPYPTGKHSDAASDWSTDSPQTIKAEPIHNGLLLTVNIDSTTYQVRLKWNDKVTTRTDSKHVIRISAKNNIDLTAEFLEITAQDAEGNILDCRQRLRKGVGDTALHAQSFNDVWKASKRFWNDYWKKGGIVDFSRVRHPKAAELERRIVLSQYLMAVNDAGNTPPQETGLTYNSWFGKFHIEMLWWHQAQFALWGHPEILERSLDWMCTVAPKARAIALRQGFDGLRWMKMTDPSGAEAPSNVGSYLIWQQPHFIHLAELLYRCQTDDGARRRLIDKYALIIDETARFMYSFASFDSINNRYILKGTIPAQETLRADSTINPPLELSYWHWGLKTAQTWRERSGMKRLEAWDRMIALIAPLAASSDSLYLAAESAVDSYSNIRFISDHPAVLGAVGMLPQSPLADDAVMRNTLTWVMKHWNWDKTWGWDFPLTAMCAARLGCPDLAVEAIMMPCRTNTYLVNGHNYQDARLRVYLPGNGGLLTAVAMMLAGWDGADKPNPGFPQDWDIRWEGLSPLP